MQVSPLPVSVILTDHDAFLRLRSTMQSGEISPMRRDLNGTRRQPLARATRGGHPRANRACAEGAVLQGNSVPCRALSRAPDSQGFDASSGRWQVALALTQTDCLEWIASLTLNAQVVLVDHTLTRNCTSGAASQGYHQRSSSDCFSLVERLNVVSFLAVPGLSCRPHRMLGN